MNNEEENYKEKDVAFYSATANAWYTTKFEKDKHLLSLASVGIGLLVTLVTAIGVKSICIATVYILAVFSFLICILTVLAIFSRNADHLQKLIKGIEDRDPILALFDKIASSSFVFGIIFTLLVGLFSGIENFNQNEVVMANDTEKQANTGNGAEKKSVDGASGLRPAKPAEESTQSPQNTQPSDNTSD